MALQARHRYVVTRLNEAFEVNDEEAVEELIRRDSVLAEAEQFLREPRPRARLLLLWEKGDYDKPGNAPLHNKNMVHNDRIALYYSDGSDFGGAARELSAGHLCVFHEKSYGQGGPHFSIRSAESSRRLHGLRYGQRSDEIIRSLLVVLVSTDAENVEQSSVGRRVRCAPDGVYGERRCFLEERERECEVSRRWFGVATAVRRAVRPRRSPAASVIRVAQAHLELLEEWCTSIEGYLGDTDRT